MKNRVFYVICNLHTHIFFKLLLSTSAEISWSEDISIFENEKEETNTSRWLHTVKQPLTFCWFLFLAFGNNLDLKTSEETTGYDLFTCISVPISIPTHPPNWVHSKYHKTMHKHPLQQNTTNPSHFMHGNNHIYHGKGRSSSNFGRIWQISRDDITTNPV